MGFKTIDYVTSFELRQPHTFALKRLGGFFTDTLEVKIDDQQVLLTQVGAIDAMVQHSHAFVVDDRPVELLWRWSPFTGNPRYIVLKSERELLATYGNKNALAKFALDGSNAGSSPKTIAVVRLLRDQLLVDRTEEVAREEYRTPIFLTSFTFGTGGPFRARSSLTHLIPPTS